MNRMQGQRGMTLIGWMLVLAIGGFFLVLAVRLVPVYLEYFSVASSVDSLKDEPAIVKKSPDKLRDLLGRRFDVNDVEHVTPKDVRIERQGEQTTVDVKYQVQVPVMGNVDALVRFDKQVTLH
ncbi:hypothetical protein BMS3Bbin12_00715 [bacterium BMS3Bbin12]|nr:hypothetical protein BMS3Abin12_00110 [bacterium BMS3Abin12]GBE47553.1 hypothetical protein BMS3Bbin12_00715 [bacterium BMS3Bbin12]GBE50982.1 hypothetical protein BMS3Bbin13_01935 [bacterium BMS3Bbin13]HDJ86879.1 DUF4845 domain-containing protein [Chromatiales bacterium]HDK02924.1 DUF4845 domain-containing protein [Gammaproteobacteria bacterium]